MLLQPVVMNVFPAEASPESGPIASATNRFGGSDSSLMFQAIERTEAMCKVQDQRIANDLHAYGTHRASTAKLLDVLQLQYDLDDMQTSAMMAKNIADKFGQAITSLTQRN
jgi:hypothetical protein